MKSRERLLDETIVRLEKEIVRLNQKITDGPIDRPRSSPTFLVKMKRNAWGQVGALLCWPDGSLVEDQVECAVTTTVDALVQVAVTFNAGVKLIEIREDDDGAKQAETEASCEGAGQEG